MQAALESDNRKNHSWLTKSRVIFYSSIVLLFDLSVPFLHLYGRYVLKLRYVVAPGWDFAVFWSASYLTIHDRAASAYDWMRIEQLALPLQGLTPSGNMLTPWVYPPTFLLAVWPAALMPFSYAYLAFVFVGLAFAVLACAQWLQRPIPRTFWFAAATFPPLWIAGICGQNSFLTAGLMAIGLAWMDRYPRLAGICLGFLVIKPQLAILVPIALVISRRWHAFASAASTALAICLIAGLVLGFDTYVLFAKTAASFGSYIVKTIHGWPAGIPTVFGAAYQAGLSIAVAYALHAVVAAAAITAMIYLWVQRARSELRSAGLVLASMLCQPYLMGYDFAWMAIALLMLWQDIVRHGWRLGEQTILTIAWLSTLTFVIPSPWAIDGVMPIILLALLTVTVLRHYASASRHQRRPTMA